MYFTLCIFSAGLRTEEPFAMLSGTLYFLKVLGFSGWVGIIRSEASGYVGGKLQGSLCRVFSLGWELTGVRSCV